MEKEKQASEALWAQIMQDLRTHGQADGYAIDFISGLRLVEDTGTRLIIEYPQGLMLAWLELNYSEYIENAAANVLKSPRELDFVEAGTLTLTGEQETPPAPVTPPLLPARKQVRSVAQPEPHVPQQKSRAT